MTKPLPLALLAALCAATATAQAEVSFDANLELDPTYVGARDNPSAKSTLDIGGRVELNANAALHKNGDNFVKARASLIVPVNGDAVRMDDLWLQLGNASADFKIGRFEAVDLFPLGLDTIVQPATGTAGPVALGSRNNFLRGRITDGRVHGALGVNLADNLRLELGMVGPKRNETVAYKPYGLRPVLVYKVGALTATAGAEILKGNLDSVPDSVGVGATLGYAVNKDMTLNVNYGRNSKRDSSSLGANALFHGALGVGFVQDKDAHAKVDTYYVAYKMPLLGVKGAYITPALNYSRGTGVDKLLAVRVRLNYAF